MDIDHAMFEGLFVRALSADGAFAAELARVGYDTKAPAGSYSGPVFLQCLDLACGHVLPGQSRDEALRELGRRFVSGFRQTLVGRIATTALPLVGPARFLPQVPRRLASLRHDARVECSLTGPTSAALTFHDPLPLGPFFAGVLEAALRVAGATTPRTVVTARPDGYVITATW